jgi:hypothetical protein
MNLHNPILLNHDRLITQIIRQINKKVGKAVVNMKNPVSVCLQVSTIYPYNRQRFDMLICRYTGNQLINKKRIFTDQVFDRLVVYVLRLIGCE